MKLIKAIVFGLMLLSVGLTLGCQSTQVYSGEWTINALIKDNVYQSICPSGIEFKANGFNYEVNGCSGVNLYNGKVVIRGNSFNASDFALTKMMGSPEAEEFERMFLDTLMNATVIEVQDNLLCIKAPSEQLELRFCKYGFIFQ